MTFPSRKVELKPAAHGETYANDILIKEMEMSYAHRERDNKAHACKYILAQVDDLRSLAYTASCQVEKPIKYIGVAIMEPHPE